MTFNIRRRMPTWRPGSPDLWSRRAPLLRHILAAEQPTVVGVQESLPDQTEFLGSALGESYGSVGDGRDARGGGERCTLFFDTRRLELQRWDQHALSATPHVPGSRSWGNRIPRIVVAAEFADRATGAQLTVLNTHLDHLSRRSRDASADFILDLVERAADRHSDAAVVVLGDLNASETSGTVARLTAGGSLRDAWVTAGERLTPAWRTYSGYRRPSIRGPRIDHILVGAGIEVARAGINAVRFGRAAASDHEPVQAVLRLPGTAGAAS